MPGGTAPISAGEPLLAEGHVTSRLPRSARELFSPPPDYFLEVKGDSMDKLGLRTGTVVAVQARPDPANNDVAVARIDDEVTLKRFVRLDKRRVALRPESTKPAHQHRAAEGIPAAASSLLGDACGARRRLSC